jgi:hypothetical protein
MMDPPPELAAAVIAVCAHHWVAHGAGAFSLEQTLSLFDGFDHVEAGLVRGVLRSVTGGRRLKPAFEELPLVRAQQTVLAGSRMRTESGSRRRMPVVGSHNRTMPSQLMEASKVCRRVPAPLDDGKKHRRRIVVDLISPCLRRAGRIGNRCSHGPGRRRSVRMCRAAPC